MWRPLLNVTSKRSYDAAKYLCCSEIISVAPRGSLCEAIYVQCRAKVYTCLEVLI